MTASLPQRNHDQDEADQQRQNQQDAQDHQIQRSVTRLLDNKLSRRNRLIFSRA
jgi:hypothetical protein